MGFAIRMSTSKKSEIRYGPNYLSLNLHHLSVISNDDRMCTYGSGTALVVNEYKSIAHISRTTLAIMTPAAKQPPRLGDR